MAFGLVPIGRRRQAHGGVKLAGECGLIAITAFEGDLGNGKACGAEKLRGVLDARFADEGAGAELEDPFHPPIQLRRRQADHRCQPIRSKFLIQMGPDVFDDFSQGRKFRILRIRSRKIAGNGGHTDDFSACIVQWDLGGEIPTQRTIAVGDEFEVVVDFPAGFKNLAVLFPIDFCEMLRKKILGGSSQQASRIGEPESGGKRVICSLIAPLRILEAEHHIRQMRKQALAKPG